MQFNKLSWRLLLTLAFILVFLFLMFGGGGKAVYGAERFVPICTPINTLIEPEQLFLPNPS